MQAEAKSAPLSTTLDLATRGYYDPAMWTPLIGAAIPPEIPGAGADERASNYAQLLAAQVRLAFPTAAIADQVRRKILPIADTAEIAAGVVDFLTVQQGQFEIGLEPVEGYLARTGLTDTPAGVISQIKRLQRVYQLTPDDGSLAVLLRHNLDSAYAITRYDSAGFVRAFGSELGGEDTATAIHARGKQIFGSVLSVAVEYLKGRAAPNLGGKAPVQYGFPPQSAPPAYPVVAYATLEELFGSLDYCNCSDCGSILSPAAYLVDLLHYIDQPAPAAGLQNPQDVLFGRRPDLQYLPLTCANTNTALPYIDIVNETLEYYVANGLSLANYQGHDTGDSVTSAELIASPQYVNDAAYAILQDAFFPPPLPFNRPLALLRLQLQSLGIALPAAMAALRANDELVNQATPMSYGWSDILIEQLCISRDEYRLFTAPALGLGDLYGLPNASALGVLQQTSLQDFSRRLGVSYDDLSAIIQTQFINPNAVLIPRLELLNSSFATLQELYQTPQSTAAEFISALPAGLDATQYGGSSPTDYQAVVNWVTGPNVYPLIMDLITISNPSGDGDECSGASLQFRYSNPDNTQNLLSATDFIKLIRFIRLWQKLTPLLDQDDDASAIEDADHILTALYPAADVPTGTSDVANDPANRALLDAGFEALLLRLGFLVQTMDALSLSGDSALDQLLACWAPIGTVGANALYQRMFLTPTLLQQDPGAQTATVASTVNVGDVLSTAINVPIGRAQVAYPVAAGQDAAATAIATAINATTSLDPVSNLPLNKRFAASSSGGVVTIKAGFTLACSTLPATATETYTAAAQSPLSHTATVTGPVTAGDTLITTFDGPLDGVQVPYIVVDGDTPDTIAAAIAAAINATTAPDPFSGLPMNNLVVAYVNPATSTVVNIITADAGAPFTLACSYQPANTGSYSAAPPVPAAQTAAITGAVSPGDTLITTINTVPISYSAGPGDTDAPALAASIAATISADAQLDPATQLPLSSIVQATSAAGVITITPVDPANPFTLACSVSTGSENYVAAGPFPESAAATVAGPIPAGATLATTINALPVVYITAPGDTPSTIAAAIADAINATTVADAVTNLPLEQVVTASAAGGVVTITANSTTTPFTLAVSVSAGGYTAGRQVAPFADDGYGDFLTDPSQTLFAHEPTLCAACNLTGAEFALVADAVNFVASTPLTLANVSALFRYGWLAHTLGLSVLEFLLLREFTGLDPFAPLDPGTPPAPAEPPVIRFTRLLSAMSTAGLDTEQALYLMWNQDISGTSAPSPTDITGLAFALRADFAAVDAAFTLQDDPDGSIAQGLMTLVYGNTASGFFFGLLNNTFTTSVPYSGPPGLSSLPQPVIDASSGRLSYDDLGKQLSFAGVLDATTQAAIDAAITVDTTDGTDNVAAGDGVSFTPASMTDIYPGSALVIDSGAAQETVIVTATTATSFTANTVHAHNGTVTPFPITSSPALAAAISSLAAANQQAVGPFFATYPELLPLYEAYVASADPPQTKRTALLASFLPILALERKQEQALASITSTAGTDPSFATTLLQDPTILHADTDPTAASITDLTAIEQQGLSAQFFQSNDPASAPDQQVDFVPVLSYAQTATIGGTVTAGDVLTTTINGVAIPCTAAAFTLAQLASNVAAAINATTAPDPATTLPLNQVVSAAATGSTVAISGLNPSGSGRFFTLACTVSAGGTLTYTAGSQLPAAPGGGEIAGIWSGYITVPQDGVYDITVAADPGATITLQLAGAVVPGQQIGGLWSNQGQITLVAGALVPITLTAGSIKTTLSVSWRSAGIGWEMIPGEYLYSLSLVNRLASTYVRFLKAASLAGALSLTAQEIAYLATATTFSVNTTGSTMITPGPATFTPASMTNLTPGTGLVIDTGSAQETITVTSTTAATFSAVAAKPHDGSASPFPIVSQTFPDISKGWLNFLLGFRSAIGDLCVVPAADVATAASLCDVLAALLDFARIKQALSPSDSRMLAVLQQPGATLPSGQPALLSLTGWAQVSVDALLTQFFSSTDPSSLATVENFRRVYDAYTIVQDSQLTASALIAAITNAPSPTMVSALQSALRARYAEADWLTVVGPINNTARIQQRDALVAYTLQQLGDSYAQSLVSQTVTFGAATGATGLTCTGGPGVAPGMLVQGTGIAPGTVVTAVRPFSHLVYTDMVIISISTGILAALNAGSGLLFAAPDAADIDTPDSLFQSLLIDPQTQPPVLTSRILLALSAVQLFIERVARNLEPQVSPADIDASQWTWMKRYRVWQANREVFLWPENWLYPELRDNQSPFFQQTTGTLLQGDITDDAAASAYLDYLTNLEEVAKLEACGMYYQPATADTDESTYVVSRTAGAHRKYYFRQLQGGSWTPWAEAQIDCEDLPITPIVWNGRLFLFWLRIVKEAEQGQADLSAFGDTPVSQFQVSDLQSFAQGTQEKTQVAISAILCWSEFYNGKWQPTKTSDVNLPTSLSHFGVNGGSVGAGAGLGTFDATGPGSFEQSTRGLLRLVPAQFTGASAMARYTGAQFTLPGDALILTIVCEGLSTDLGQGFATPFGFGGFILHNTHSLPVRLDDILVPSSLLSDVMTPLWCYLDPPSPSRTLSAVQPSPGTTPLPPFSGAFGSGTFSITYEDVWGEGAVWTNPVLDFTWMPRLPEPQPALPGAWPPGALTDVWEAPFIYEDRRHAFYVKTTETVITVRRYDGYGVPSVSRLTASRAEISPLVLRKPVVTATPGEIVAINASRGAPGAVQRYLQGTDLNAAVISPAAIIYQGRVISPIGSAPTPVPAASDNGKGA